MNAAIVAQITGYGYAETAGQRVALIAIDAITELHAQRLIPLADGIGAAIDAAAAPGGHTTVAHVPLVGVVALTDAAITVGVLAALLGAVALGRQLAAMSIARVAALADAFGFAQLIAVAAGGMRVADVWFLETKHSLNCIYSWQRQLMCLTIAQDSSIGSQL